MLVINNFLNLASPVNQERFKTLNHILGLGGILWRRIILIGHVQDGVSFDLIGGILGR